MKVTVKVNGYKQAKLNAAELVDKIGRGAMREALTKAARLMTAAVRANAPVGATGLLKKSIRQKVITNTKWQSVAAFIGPSNNVKGVAKGFTGKDYTVRPSKYAHLVEFGTTSRGVWGNAGWKMEPGNPPNPFMRKAYESTKKAAHDKYKAELAPAIERAAAKIRKRAIPK